MRIRRLAALVLLLVPLAAVVVSAHGGPIKAIAVSADGKTARI